MTLDARVMCGIRKLCVILEIYEETVWTYRENKALQVPHVTPH